MLCATNILWDTDGDNEVLEQLPTTILLPPELQRNPDHEEVSDYITEQTGFCHFGFDIEEYEAG